MAVMKFPPRPRRAAAVQQLIRGGRGVPPRSHVLCAAGARAVGVPLPVRPDRKRFREGSAGVVAVRDGRLGAEDLSCN